ncbi:hypothetical protein N0V90_005358 [Kalmusia sp. IMI 367209]|nr:hypothetical protein N0V90_005358 [Kalmusia sp. IMI 367209]
MDTLQPYVVDPPEGIVHTHTIILLHGRGSTAKEFATDLFSLKTSTSHKSLRDSFPSVWWVFPDAGQRWCTAFKEARSAWFDTVSLDHLDQRQDLQIPGLRDSIAVVKDIIESEVDKLNGDANRIALGGFSQGSAVALWSLFTGVVEAKRSIGAFMGLSAWMPFTKEAMVLVSSDSDLMVYERFRNLQEGFAKLVGFESNILGRGLCTCPEIPVYLGHGTDDALINIENCYCLSTIFTAVGAIIEVKEYTGADREGHWVKDPEQIDDIAEFLRRVLTKAD